MSVAGLKNDKPAVQIKTDVRKQKQQVTTKREEATRTYWSSLRTEIEKMSSGFSVSKQNLTLSTQSISATDVDVSIRDNKKTRLASTKIIIILLLFLAVLLAVAVALVVVVIKEKNEEKIEQEKEEVCMSQECVIAAARFAASMDTTQDPCEDFYTFTCGRWRKTHVIPEDKSITGTFDNVVDDVDIILNYLLAENISSSDMPSIMKAKSLYQSCVRTDIIEDKDLDPAYGWLDALNGWPVLGMKRGGNWNSSLFNLEESMIRIRKYSNNAPVISIYAYDDSKNPTNNVLYIDQPSLGMPSREYYLKERNDTTLKAYEKYAVEMAVMFGADRREAEIHVAEVIDLETELANLSLPEDQRRDEEKMYNRMTISELQQKSPEFNWLKFIREILKIDGVNIDIDENEPVVVRNTGYAESVFSKIKEVPERVLDNYIAWMAMKSASDALPKRVRKLNLNYKKVLLGSETEQPRWKSCASIVNNIIGLAVGKLFIKETFDLEARTTALEMIENLRKTMKDLLDENQWMDDQTKTVAKDKADAIEPRIGFPDEVLDDSYLTKRYENYTFTDTEYFSNSLSYMQVYVVENLRKLRKPVDRKKWELPPATVNAYYNPSRNQIMFPAGILQPPFYQKRYPQYLNYGGIGFVIGHEITHGFDDMGRLFDKNGNLKQWWTNTSITNFKAKADCIKDQYGNFTVVEANQNLNGLLTLGENIADNGGLKESWMAYEKWIKSSNGGMQEPILPGLKFSQKQLFFLNAGYVWCGLVRPKEAKQMILTDPHSDYRSRVIGPLQNNKDFSDAFNCRKGSYMNPEKKCIVW